MAPVLQSISPMAGPPGTAITCLGAGFDSGAQAFCPGAVDTEYVNAAELRAAIPADLVGAPGASMVVSVAVENEDGSRSAALPFTVRFASSAVQSWTNLRAVVAEVPGFTRGGTIKDSTVEGWMRSIAQSINGALLRRGLSLNPNEWQTPDAETGMPAAAGVLELINRLGAAARLAHAVSAQFSASGDWALAKNLQSEYMRELKALQDGAYDKLFRPGAATIESGVQVSGGDIVTDRGDAEQAFSKTQMF